MLLTGALYIWRPLAPLEPNQVAPAQVSFGKDDPIVTCAVQGTPAQGVYRDFTGEERVARFTIRTRSGADYFVMLEDATLHLPVMTFFINGGSTFNVSVPLGSFTVIYAAGNSWCGDTDMFGSETVFGEAEDTFTFRRTVADTGDGYTTTSTSHWTIELILQRGGNLKIKKISRDEFFNRGLVRR